MLLSEKIFYVRFATGRAEVLKNGTDGKCEIITGRVKSGVIPPAALASGN